MADLMRIAYAVVLPAALLGAGICLAQTIQGAGVSTCAEYAAVARSGGPRQVQLYENWVLGYLSGSNLILSTLNPRQDILRTVTPAQIGERLRTACLAPQNAQKQIRDVALEMMRELQFKEKNAR